MRQALPHLRPMAPAISVKLAKLQFILSDSHHAEHSLASFHAGGTPNQKPEVSEPSAFL